VAIPNKTITWAGAVLALVISGLIAFLVSEWMWVGIVLFLASDAANQITGTEVWIDGGSSLVTG